MAQRKPKDERKDERNPEWERFDAFVKKIAAVPKEEVDEKRAEEKREKKEKRAG
jgi:hypothetical protein